MKSKRIKVKDFNKELASFGYNIEFSKKDAIEKVQNKNKKNITFIKINNLPSFLYYNNQLIPTIKFLHNNQNLLKKVTIDMGAVRFIAGGADVMHPGIVDFQEGIKENEIVAVQDQNNKTIISVAKSKFNYQELKEKTKGKSFLNIHYVGDSLWNL